MKRLFIGVAALCCLATYAAATVHDIDNFRNPDGTPLIVPRPQQYEAKSGVFRLPETLTVEAPASEKIILEYLSAELKRFSRKVVPGDRGAANCRFIMTRDGVPENEEGYALRGVGDEWAAVSSTYEGKASESSLKELREANTRRLCFFFNRVSATAEIYIDDLGETPECYDIVPEWGPGRGERY